jgi:hypothetical protein
MNIQQVASMGVAPHSGWAVAVALCSLGAILASHALIHTADGDHFRNALAAAALER